MTKVALLFVLYITAEAMLTISTAVSHLNWWDDLSTGARRVSLSIQNVKELGMKMNERREKWGVASSFVYPLSYYDGMVNGLWAVSLWYAYIMYYLNNIKDIYQQTQNQ